MRAVEDTLVLPRVAEPDPGLRWRVTASSPPLPRVQVRDSRSAGVRRRGPRQLDPFVHMDQMGEVETPVSPRAPPGIRTGMRP